MSARRARKCGLQRLDGAVLAVEFAQHPDEDHDEQQQIEQDEGTGRGADRFTGMQHGIAADDPDPVEPVEVVVDALVGGAEGVHETLPRKCGSIGAVAAEHRPGDPRDPTRVLRLKFVEQPAHGEGIGLAIERRIVHAAAQFAHVVWKVGIAALEGFEEYGLTGRRVAADPGFLIDLRALERGREQLRLTDERDLSEGRVEPAHEPGLGDERDRKYECDQAENDDQRPE